MTPPNIVLILADDLGHGMLSCYGQRHFRTPSIDRLAQEGVRCTAAYGTPFCATARATLLTGIRDTHAGGWTFVKGGLYRGTDAEPPTVQRIQEQLTQTGIQPRCGQLFLASLARAAGLVTGQIGKLEWGFSTSHADIASHGWDWHYGFYDHLLAHGFYPPYLFENGQRIAIPGNTRADAGAGQYTPYVDGSVPHDPDGRVVHTQDLYDERLLAFLRGHRDRPFFLAHPTQLPHGPTYFPDHDPQVAGREDLTPVEREYASMILRLDRTVGLVLDELDRLGLRDRTLVVLASDNGHYPNYPVPGRCDANLDLQGRPIDQLRQAFRSHTCGDIFDGNGGLAGLKTTNWEGGARVPLLMRWPGMIPAGPTCDALITHYDLLPTFAEILQVPLPPGASDGCSWLPAVCGRAGPRHEDITYASYLGPSLVTHDGWKVRTVLRRDRIIDFGTFGTDYAEIADAIVWQLYQLRSDPGETTDLAAQEPQRLRTLQRRMLQRCDGNLVHGTPEAHFAFVLPP